ncbi:MAG: glycerate kinase [Actinomycetota bacterium]|nr:glycerate kinase [Actinomycetota bacterium]
MKVVVAPDSFGGTLSAVEAAEAIANGWSQVRGGDEIVRLPLADGGEGTLEAVARDEDEWRTVEVADPLGRPRVASWLWRSDGTAIVESAEACGLKLLKPAERNPLRTTTYGVGQLLEEVRGSGCHHIAVGLGGSATVDGGAGAATALGVRVLRGGGSGVRIGGGGLVDVTRVVPQWLDPDWRDVEVVLWSDVETVLADAAASFGPQKGATPEAVERLAAGLARWAEVVERDLGGAWRHLPGSGAAGGLGFGLAAVFSARLVGGARAVAELVGLDDALEDADLVVTGEGRLDATSLQGKVVGAVLRSAAERDARVVGIVGEQGEKVEGLADIEPASQDGPGRNPAAEVAAAAERLAVRIGS